MILFVTTLALAAEPCPEVPRDAVLDAAQAMENAYLNADDGGFTAAHAALDQAVGCLAQPLEQADVVVVHRAKALGGFFNGELAATRKSWAAVQQLDSSWQPSTDLVPEGHPLRGVWDSIEIDDQLHELERAPEGGWLVDGTAATSVPDTRAFFLQGLDSTGLIVHNGYHYSPAEVPTVDFAALDASAATKRRRRMRTWGTALAGVLAAGGGTTLVLASGNKTNALADETDPEAVESFATSANTLSNLSVGLWSGSAAVATAAWAIRW